MSVTAANIGHPRLRDNLRRGLDGRESHEPRGSASPPFLMWFPSAIFVCSLLLRLGIGWKAGFFHHFEHNEMAHIAISLATQHRYANPFVIPTGPTAHEMPLYPVFQSAIYGLFGISPKAEAVKLAISCVVTALRCAMVPLLCIAAGLGRRAAIAAGILSSAYISALQAELRGNWDSPWQAVALLGLIWATWRLWTTRRWVQRTPWGYFLLWGAALLLQPAFVTILAAFLVTGFTQVDRSERLRYCFRCTILALVIAAFLAPWAIRNYFTFGKLIVTRDNFGLEFWVSNGPNRAYDMRTNFGRVPHPSADLPAAQEVLRMGELKYNEAKLRAATEWVRGNTKQFTRLTLIRFLAFWFPPGGAWVQRLAGAALSVLSLFGLTQLYRTNRTIAVLFSLCWLCFPLVYYIVQWSSRYRYPIEWQLIVCASMAISSMWRRSSELNRGYLAPRAKAA